MKRWKKLIITLGMLIILFLLWSIYWGITPKNVLLIFNPHKVTPVSPLYYIKIPREYLQSQFVFGDYDLSLWNFTLANKKLEEIKILNSYHLNNVAKTQTEIAKSYQNKGIYYLNKLIDKVDVNYLMKFRDENQKVLDSLI